MPAFCCSGLMKKRVRSSMRSVRRAFLCLYDTIDSFSTVSYSDDIIAMSRLSSTTSEMTMKST